MSQRPSWSRPTDGPYAFQLHAPVHTPGCVPGSRTHVDEALARVMTPEMLARFNARVGRWGGPEDVAQDGSKPLEQQQLFLEEAVWQHPLGMAHVRRVLAGDVLVMQRSPLGQVDYVMRDHHMLDAVLHHFGGTGQLPTAMLHVDRHSDWCDDRFLMARKPEQAATWWGLLHGLKRPNGAPVLDEKDVHFATALAPVKDMPGRNVGASVWVPGCVDPAAMDWGSALERAQDALVDWVSLDLDYFQPAAQVRVVKGLLRDARFHTLMAQARVRVFVLSPQFTGGGDRFEDWRVQGSVSSSLRLLNLLRSPEGLPRPRPSRAGIPR